MSDDEEGRSSTSSDPDGFLDRWSVPILVSVGSLALWFEMSSATNGRTVETLRSAIGFALLSFGVLVTFVGLGPR